MQAFQVADMAETPSLPTMLTTKATLHKNPKDPKPYAPYHIPLPHPTTSQKQSVCVWLWVDLLVEDIEVANMIYYSSVCFTSLFSRFYQKRKIKKFWKNQSIDINRHQTTNDQSTLINRPMICEEWGSQWKNTLDICYLTSMDEYI